MLKRPGSILTGSLLVAGTAIGAGMLALPFATGAAGFWPAIWISALCWLYMLFTGLLFLEVTLWMPNGANLLSMARHFLGPIGWFVGGMTFVYLYYCLMVAYFAGAVPLIMDLAIQLLGIQLHAGVAYAFFFIVFGGIVFLGQRVTGRVNSLLVLAMIISYGLLIGLGAGEVRSELLSVTNWPLAWAAIPTLFSAFGYLNVIPSLSMYLRRDVRKLRWAIIIGTFIPFLTYAIWQWMMIGTIPQEFMAAARAAELSIIAPLEILIPSPWLATAARYFALFAITTSVLGVGISMVDFLGDGTGIPRSGWGRLLLVLMVFAPPLVLSGLDPALFFKALHYAGVFGEATLNGLFPALMVWVGRHVLHLKKAFWLPMGRVGLSIVICMAVLVLAGEVLQLAGLWGI